MKFFSLLVLSTMLASAADFLTGQAARLVIGQPTFTAQNTGTPSAFQLGAVGGLAYANNSLFVVDSNRVQATPVNNRVLIYNNISSFVGSPTASVPQGIRCPVCAGTPDVKQASVVLGQPDFSTANITLTAAGQSATSFRTPTAVATDGHILVVADTDNNRVLIWKSIPQTNGQAPDLALGQPDLKTVKPPATDNKSFRGPQGVWIQGTRLYVADTQNHRIMIWNNIPTSSDQPADLELGQPNFTTATQQNPTQSITTSAANLLNPVSVTSDGQRLYVTDLGHNRVLIWNTIPTQNAQPADIALGQPDLVSGTDNNAVKMCASNGLDTNNNPTYPVRCGPTLSFPRYALSDGQRLFIADGGNDRIVVFDSIPTTNGAKPDVYLGQPDEFTDQVTDSTDTFRPDANITRSSADSIRTPLSLAWDGTNLYASDPFDMRVLVYTPGTASVPLTGVSNAFSKAVFAIGTVDFSGTITANDTVTVTIQGKDYKYTIQKTDTLTSIVNSFVTLINAPPGDPNVFAIANTDFNELVLSSKIPGMNGNNTTLAVAASTSATIVATASGANLSRGNTAAEVAPGTLVSITGMNLADSIATGQPDADGRYPSTLAGVNVYFDGIKAPLLYVSPTQINTQIPFEVQDTNSVSSYVVTRHLDGSVTNSVALGVPIVMQNPGLLAADGQDPRPAMAFHTTSYATGVVDLEGTIKANDTVTLTIDANSYTYTVQTADTLVSIRDALIGLVNADASSRVTALPAGQYTRIILQAKVQGPDGNGIPISVTTSSSSQVTATALQAATCCASIAGAPITPDNPAVPGEIISVYATGIGLIQPDEADAAAQTGVIYQGPAFNYPNVPVDDAQVGGSTANVLNVTMVQGMLGVYEVQLQLNSSIPDNPLTQMFIAQNVFTSNIVTIPVQSPATTSP